MRLESKILSLLSHKFHDLETFFYLCWELLLWRKRIFWEDDCTRCLEGEISADAVVNECAAARQHRSLPS